jgi:hypothetical protein
MSEPEHLSQAERLIAECKNPPREDFLLGGKPVYISED